MPAKKLTDGEKMIWTAVYAAKFNESQNLRKNYGPAQTREEEIESNMGEAVTAVDCAWGAVNILRDTKTKDAIVRGFGIANHVYQFYKEMTEENEEDA